MTTNYWDQRIERLNREVFRDSESYVRELRKIYDTETEKIQDSIYSQLLKLQEEAGEISLAEAKKLLNDREKKIFKDSLDDFIKKATGKINVDTERELNIISRRVRISRLQAMEVELKKTVAGLMSREEKGLFAHLGGTYEKRYYKELYELQRITGYKSVQSVNKSELNTLIKNPWTSDGQEFSERIWGRGEKLTTSLRDNLIRDIARGNSPKESARNIQRLFDVSKASASRLVFTETAAVNAKATQDSYEKLGVKQYQILATLDLKTSDICRSMDSKIFDYKDYRIGITAPPFHPNCRSDTVPYFGDEFEKEIDQGIGRMARDPESGESEPVENLTYEDWHKKYVEGLPIDSEKSNIPSETVEPPQKYTKAETDDALDYYVSGDGMWINNYLRGRSPDIVFTEDDKIYLERLDQATTLQNVKEKTLYRSVDVSAIIGDISDFDYDDLRGAYFYGDDSKRAKEIMEKYLKNIQGKEIVDKGFLSTTKSKDIALEFQGFTGSSKSCVIEFNVPDGIKGVDLKDFDIADSEQREVLLARGQKFVIKEMTQEQGQFYFKADLILNNGYNVNEEIELPKLKKVFKEDDYKEFKKIISENTNEDIQKLYKKYGDEINHVYISDKGCYNSARNELSISINSEEEVKSGINKFSTVAHEYGHSFDHNATSDLTHTDLKKIREVIPESLAPAKDLLSSSDEFMQAIREDKANLKSIGFKKLVEELRDEEASKGIQDAIDGMFEGSKYRISWGHGEKYYNRKYNKIKYYADLYGEDYDKILMDAFKELGYKIKAKKDMKSLIRDYETASEAWANIMSAVTCGGSELEFAEKYLPKSLEALLKIIKGVN
ncbi:phage protein F-like protein [Peptoniphilus duerdenii ATCC BAA-1640]|uniref:Phage protein F-like protein n=1 Tax=Peptoniphilus duerdenii ATCC BAA-1640 TaxID=862517 RepID=E0NNB2_9FIRM|nr:minor capsid protein [Peptoniphilus duerdenii]EFM24785.1 phage protein F-like protein [Peptoniphilus duerdenii ATCC BAA-1640]